MDRSTLLREYLAGIPELAGQLPAQQKNEATGRAGEAGPALATLSPPVFNSFTVRKSFLGDELPGPPAPGITGGPTSQTPPALAGGIDTLEVTIYGHLQPGPLGPSLHFAQLAAQKGGDSQTDSASHFDLPSGRVVVVKERGMKWGNAWLDYCLEVEGIFIGLAKESGSETKPTAYVRLGAIALLRWGSFGAWYRALEILAELGLTVTRDVVSRVDLYCDLFTELGGFISSVLADCYVTRGDDESFWRKRRKFNGYYAKTKNCTLRVYDKLLELDHTQDQVKRELLQNARWGGAPSAVTRYEYQLRREWLQDRFGIKRVDDLFASLGKIAGYLVDEWFRLTAKSVDRENNHQSRDRTGDSALWADVQAQFAQVFGHLDAQLPVEEVKVPSVVPLAKQAVGCCLTALALLGVHCETVSEIVEGLRWVLTRGVTSDVSQRLDERHAKWFNHVAGAESIVWEEVPF